MWERVGWGWDGGGMRGLARSTAAWLCTDVLCNMVKHFKEPCAHTAVHTTTANMLGLTHIHVGLYCIHSLRKDV